MELIVGTRVNGGECILGEFDTTRSLEEYKKQVELIDIDRVESSLTVKNYLVFYAMVKGIYHEKVQDELRRLSYQTNMDNILERPVNDLNKNEKIKVRCLASYMRNVHCLVGKDLFEDLLPEQKEEVVSFLENFFCENNCLCILFEDVETTENTNHSILII